MQAVLLKHDALNLGGVATMDEIHVDAVFFQGRAQLVPVLAFGSDADQRIVNLILHGICSSQPFAVDVVLAFRHVQVVYLCEFLANLGTTHPVALVGNQSAIVVDAVEYQMTVGMLTVIVAHKDVLCVLDVHPLHILMCDLTHQVVINLVNILNREV